MAKKAALIGAVGATLLLGYIVWILEFQTQGFQGKSQSTENQLRLMCNALELYALEHGEYPESLDALLLPDPSGEPFLRRLAPDRWGRAILYSRSAEGGFRVWSLGADGLPGGVGNDADKSVTLPWSE